MAYCLERFNPGKEKGSARVRFMKKSIYDEIKTATNTYIDSVAQKNKI